MSEHNSTYHEKIILFELDEEISHEEAQSYSSTGYKSLLKGFWIFKIFCIFFSLLFLLSSFFLAALVALSAVIALGRKVYRQPDWDIKLRKNYCLLCRSLVLALSSFVGIFSTQFGIAVATVYFTIIDSNPNLVNKFKKAFEY